MIDEGYTKFDVDWRREPGRDSPAIRELDAWRRRLYAAGLVGHDAKHGVGYGNLSVRDSRGFLISGTQTGHLPETGAEHYARVIDVDIANNRVTCVGPVQASSESMTHAAIYDAAPAVAAIVHAHDHDLWRRSLNVLPTTSADVPYGTPDMAGELARLIAETDFGAAGVAAMAGHEDGLIAIGATLEEAAKRMLALAVSGERAR